MYGPTMAALRAHANTPGNSQVAVRLRLAEQPGLRALTARESSPLRYWDVSNASGSKQCKKRCGYCRYRMRWQDRRRGKDVEAALLQAWPRTCGYESEMGSGACGGIPEKAGKRWARAAGGKTLSIGGTSGERARRREVCSDDEELCMEGRRRAASGGGRDRCGGQTEGRQGSIARGRRAERWRRLEAAVARAKWEAVHAGGRPGKVGEWALAAGGKTVYRRQESDPGTWTGVLEACEHEEDPRLSCFKVRPRQYTSSAAHSG
ncbi:hypothetical protein C8R44DRAFT_723814 [Mycena epipterygia]|nr:hypothetical protein C8R44DRAFT_723814 [Mycena epipterygia]